MKKKSNINNIFSYFIFSLLSILFVIIIDERYYPDYDSLNYLLLNHSSSLIFTPHLLLKNFYFYFFENQFTYIYGSTNRLQFYIITLITIIFFSRALYLNSSNSYVKKNQIETLYLTSLMYPSTLLAITASSAEAIYNILIFFFIINFQKRNFSVKEFIIIFVLFFLLLKLDFGNFIVFIFFWISLLLPFLLRKYLNIYMFFFILIIFVFFVFLNGESFFQYFGKIIDSEKTNNLIFEKSNIGLANLDLKEIVLRYFYFWFTLLVLHFPVENYFILYSGIGGLIILLTLCLLLIIFNKNTNRKFKFILKKDVNQIIYIWMIIFPFLFISILPAHAYYKYLSFFIIFIIRLLFLILGEKKLIISVSLISFISMIEFLIRV